MINYYYELDFSLDSERLISNWISDVIQLENRKAGEINYIFCDDNYLLKINQDFLNHDTYTDIISFDYSVGKELHGDIYISIPRVRENATSFKVQFSNELQRVIVHGILHYCGYKDKTSDDKKLMRSKEDHYISLIN